MTKEEKIKFIKNEINDIDEHLSRLYPMLTNTLNDDKNSYEFISYSNTIKREEMRKSIFKEYIDFLNNDRIIKINDISSYASKHQMESFKRNSSCKEFISSGFLWLINSILHVFGWTILVNPTLVSLLDYYELIPVKTSLKGFSEDDNNKGYSAISEYIKNHTDNISEYSGQFDYYYANDFLKKVKKDGDE